MNSDIRNVLGVLLLIAVAQVSVGGTVVGSKHDLSYSGNPYGNAGITAEQTVDEICVFCHTPHNANTDLDQDSSNDQGNTDHAPAPLWNRQISDVTQYEMYSSSTMNALYHGAPSPLSLACLSCHDGATASGNVGAVSPAETHNLMNPPNDAPSTAFPPINARPNCNACHGRDPEGNGFPEVPGKWWQIGPDLTNDHPVSMDYGDAVTEDIGNFLDPPDAAIKLFLGRVECPSCHNPHDPTNVPFLRKTVVGSGLCLGCHDK